MFLFRYTRVLVVTLFLIAPVLLIALQPVGAVQPDPTPTAPDGGTLPFTQADLREFTGNVSRPNGMVWLNDEIFVVCAGDQTVYKLYGTSGATDTYIYGVMDAHTIYAEQQANGAVDLWVPDYKAGSLLRVTPTDVEVIASDMFGPWGIVFLTRTTFLVSNRLNGMVELVTRSGERVPYLEGLALPTGLAHDTRFLYVANSGDPDRAVEWYPLQMTPDDQTVGEHTLISGLDRVMSIQVGPDGYLYFAYEKDELGVIGRIDPEQCRTNGGCTAEEVEPVVLTEMPAPLAGLTFAPDGRLFFHERYGTSLYWVPVSG